MALVSMTSRRDDLVRDAAHHLAEVKAAGVTTERALQGLSRVELMWRAQTRHIVSLEFLPVFLNGVKSWKGERPNPSNSDSANTVNAVPYIRRIPV